MPLYRDDQGALYHSWRTDLRGEPVPTGAIQMPEDAWLRVARVKPEWAARLPRAALGLAALSVLGLTLFLPFLLLFGPLAATASLTGVWLIVSLCFQPLLAIACQQVAMNRRLYLITPQPRSLIILELLRLWVALVPIVGLLLMFGQQSLISQMKPWLLGFIGLLALVFLAFNARFLRQLRRGTAVAG